MCPAPKYTIPEAALAQRISAGDQDAFRELYDQCHPAVFTLMMYYFKEVEMAKDMVQQVFLKLWEKRARLAEVQNLRAYLFVVARRQALDQLKALARTSRLIRFPEGQEFAQTGSPESPIDEKEFLQLLHQAVHRLPPRQQQVWRLAEEQQLDHEAIAKEMQLNKKTVRKHLELARKSVRSFLTQHLHFIIFF